MDNNILEMLLKMMPGLSPQTPPQASITSYPTDSFPKQNQNDFGQNNLLPLILSLLNKNTTPNIMSQNKKAEDSSAPNDEILL